MGSKMRKLIIVAVMLLFTSHYLSAQVGLFDFFESSHFARSMRLGNAYTGVAEGPEAIFYNAAGLADVNSYSVVASSGQGIAFYVDKLHAYDFSAAVPLGKAGTVGASVNSLVLNFRGSDASYQIYALSYAYKFFNSLSLGLTGNYYDFEYDNIAMCGPRLVTGSAYDINVSALYQTPVRIFTQDVFKVGFQFKNLLNSKVSLNFTDQKDRIYQSMRGGFSYTLMPDLNPISGFIPIKFMAAFDAVYIGVDYTFYEWQPNYGLELTLLEVLQLSFGRENEKQLKETYTYSPQHPVNRYGVGLNVPLNRLFDMNYGLDLRLDYCKSDWQKIDEDNAGIPGLIDRVDVQDDAFSVGVAVEY